MAGRRKRTWTFTTGRLVLWFFAAFLLGAECMMVVMGLTSTGPYMELLGPALAALALLVVTVAILLVARRGPAQEKRRTAPPTGEDGRPGEVQGPP